MEIDRYTRFVADMILMKRAASMAKVKVSAEMVYVTMEKMGFERRETDVLMYRWLQDVEMVQRDVELIAGVFGVRMSYDRLEECEVVER